MEVLQTELYPKEKIKEIPLFGDPLNTFYVRSVPPAYWYKRYGSYNVDEQMRISGNFFPTDELYLRDIDDRAFLRLRNSLMYVTEGGGVRRQYFVPLYTWPATPIKPEGSGTFELSVKYDRKNWLWEQGVELQRANPHFEIQDTTVYSFDKLEWTTALEHDLEEVRNVIAIIYVGFWTTAVGHTKYLRVQISKDGVTWTTILEVETAATEERYAYIMVGNTNFRYIRYQMRSYALGYPGQCRIRKALYFYK